MRTSPTRLLASVTMLFACGLGLQQCGQPTSQQPGDGGAAFAPVATIDQIMDSLVIPSSQKVFDAVVYSNGQLVVAPKTNEDWLAVQSSAIVVAEAGNLLLMPPRAVDNAEWMQMSLALNSSAARAAEAARKKSVEDLLAAGSEMYEACAACHEKYVPEEEL